MNKKTLFSLLGIFTAFILFVVIGLGFTILSKPHSGSDIVNNLKEIKAYKSDVTIQTINDMQTLNYKGHQTYKKNLGCKLELTEGRTLIFKGEEISVVDKENGEDYKVDKAFDEVFKYSFIGEYIGLIYTNEEINYKKQTINDEELLLIETLIPGSNRNLFKGILYISIKDNLPKKLIIYDNKSKERIIYTYENFNLAVKIEDREF